VHSDLEGTPQEFRGFPRFGSGGHESDLQGKVFGSGGHSIRIWRADRSDLQGTPDLKTSMM
jgi:hypothetical protein